MSSSTRTPPEAPSPTVAHRRRDNRAARLLRGTTRWFRGSRALRWLRRDEVGVVSVLVLLIAVVGIRHPGFLDADNLLSTAQSSVYVGVIAAGMVFPLAMREVDLSVGGNYALTAVGGAVLMRDGVPPWFAVAIVLIGATALGALNGIVTTAVKAPSFIVTLATALLFHGLALALSSGKQITDLPADSSVFNVLGDQLWGAPTSVWVFGALVVVLTVVFTMTRFGARVRAIGSNPDAAVFTGIPVARVRIQALAMSGFTAGVGGVLTLAFYIAGDPTIGVGYELTAIAACIIGGTPLIGGRGSVPGAAIGVLILTVVAASLVFFGVPINWTTFATGAVILTAVVIDSLLRRTRRRRGPA